jgi:periplasmic copper chaperone A
MFQKELETVKRILMLVFTISLWLSACGAEKGIEVHDFWIRPAAQGENGAVYFVIYNHSSKADELIGVSSDVAQAVEIHESKMTGDVMEMHQLESVPLEARAEIEFAPGKLHLMLVDLQKDLKTGDEIEITLHFKNFDDLNVIVPVRDIPASEEHH